MVRDAPLRGAPHHEGLRSRSRLRFTNDKRRAAFRFRLPMHGREDRVMGREQSETGYEWVNAWAATAMAETSAAMKGEALPEEPALAVAAPVIAPIAKPMPQDQLAHELPRSSARATRLMRCRSPQASRCAGARRHSRSSRRARATWYRSSSAVCLRW